MMNREPLSIVHNYLDAIVRKDFDHLNLGPGFYHQSPFGRIESIPEFIEACKLVVAGTRSIDIQRELVKDNTVCVYYEAQTPTGPMPMTEWFTIRNGQIVGIDVFFDASVRQPGK